MVLLIADTYSVGGGHAVLRVVIIGGGTGNTSFWIRNMGSKPLHGEYPGGVPPLGGKTDHGATPP